MKVYDDIHSAYLGTLKDVLENPDFTCSPRGMKILEKLDYQFKILNPVAEAIVTKDLERNKVIADYTAKEVELYNSCSNRVEDFAKASKFWEKIANPDGTINSAYGYLIWKKKSCGNKLYECGSGRSGQSRNTVNAYGKALSEYKRTPWEWVKQSLIKDKDTRQAILRFSLPEHQWVGNLDQTCTLNGNFLIREDKLYFTVNMRSNDLFRGLVYDFFWFLSLMDRMIEELKDTYPNLSKGTYTHNVHSIHIYEKDIPAIKRMICDV